MVNKSGWRDVSTTPTEARPPVCPSIIRPSGWQQNDRHEAPAANSSQLLKPGDWKHRALSNQWVRSGFKKLLTSNWWNHSLWRCFLTEVKAFSTSIWEMSITKHTQAKTRLHKCTERSSENKMLCSFAAGNSAEFWNTHSWPLKRRCFTVFTI